MLAANEIKVNSNELVQILTLSSEEILGLSSPFGCELSASPVYTYPFFGEAELVSLAIPSGTPESVMDALEVVICVDLSVRNGGLFCFLGASAAGILAGPCQLIREKLAEMMKSAGLDLEFISDWSVYQERTRVEQHESGTAMESVLIPQGKEFYKVLTQNAPFYNRLQSVLLPFFIEAATPINLCDPKWSVFVDVSDAGADGICRALLTCYNYFRFPEGLRVRISQVLVFPRFQSKGLGSALYNSVTSALRCDPECQEICVEDPTDGFERLRGFNDWMEWNKLTEEELNVESSSIESSKSESSSIEANKSEANKSEANKSEANKSEANKSEANKSESSKSEANKSESSKIEANKIEANKRESNKSESNKIESNNTDDKLLKKLKITQDHANRLINLSDYYNNFYSANKQKLPTPKRSKSTAFDSFRKRVKLGLLRKFKKDLPEGQTERIEKLAELFESEVEEFLEPVSESIARAKST